MHNGFQVLDVPISGGSSADVSLVAHNGAHASLAYGADWVSFGRFDGSAARWVGSCSFYDRAVKVWHF